MLTKSGKMRAFLCLAIAILLVLAVLAVVLARYAGSNPPAQPGVSAAWPANLPVYDHIVIVMEENKDYNLSIFWGNCCYMWFRHLHCTKRSAVQVYGSGWWLSLSKPNTAAYSTTNY